MVTGLVEVGILVGAVVVGLYFIPKYAAPAVRKWMHAGKEVQQVIKDERQGPRED